MNDGGNRMAQGKKKRKITSESRQARDQAISALVDCVLEELQEEDPSLESFEGYSKSLRNRIQAAPDVFRKRFIGGYELLKAILAEKR